MIKEMYLVFKAQPWKIRGELALSLLGIIFFGVIYLFAEYVERFFRGMSRWADRKCSYLADNSPLNKK